MGQLLYGYTFQRNFTVVNRVQRKTETQTWLSKRMDLGNILWTFHEKMSYPSRGTSVGDVNTFVGDTRDYYNEQILLT